MYHNMEKKKWCMVILTNQNFGCHKKIISEKNTRYNYTIFAITFRYCRKK